MSALQDHVSLLQHDAAARLWVNGNVAFFFFNSLAPGRFENNSKKWNFQTRFPIVILSNFYEIANRRLPLSIVIQVMAWCRQTTSHYLSQCWPRSASPDGVTKQQWVTELPLAETIATASDYRNNAGPCDVIWTSQRLISTTTRLFAINN